MVNAKHDAASYESCSYQRDIFDGNVLFDAFGRAKRGSDWKPQVQNFEMTYLLGISRIQKELRDKTYEFFPTSEFVLNERGKTRYISGEQIPDRIAKHGLCDEMLVPTMRKYLIYDNGASLKYKGIDFTRRRLSVHLQRYYAQNKTNDGYILLIDFSKYYDNIRHDKLLEMFEKHIHDEHALWLLRKTIERARVDVSYMDDEEYANCMDKVFNSLEHSQISRELLTGEKFMDKHLNIGDQVAQVAGIAYPIPIDNYIKIVRSVKFYGRYMDDSYIIHHDKQFLKDLLQDIIRIANSIGITVNIKKTRICKLSSYWRFLQVQYSLTRTGRIIKKIHPKRITAMRRKMKKLVNILTPKEFEDWYQSWFKNYYKIMSKLQRQNMNSIYEELKEKNKNVHSNIKQRGNS